MTYKREEVKKVVAPEFGVEYEPRDQAQDEYNASKNDEGHHRRDPGVVNIRYHTALGVGDVECGW